MADVGCGTVEGVWCDGQMQEFFISLCNIMLLSSMILIMQCASLPETFSMQPHVTHHKNHTAIIHNCAMLRNNNNTAPPLLLSTSNTALYNHQQETRCTMHENESDNIVVSGIDGDILLEENSDTSMKVALVISRGMF